MRSKINLFKDLWLKINLLAPEDLLIKKHEGKNWSCDQACRIAFLDKRRVISEASKIMSSLLNLGSQRLDRDGGLSIKGILYPEMASSIVGSLVRVNHIFI